MAARYLEGTRAAMQQQADRLWARFLEEQRAVLGLRADQSLDTEIVYTARGPVARILPVTEARTLRYVEVVSDSASSAALEIDDWAQAQQGRGGVDVRGHKAFEDLPQTLRERARPLPPELAQQDDRLGGNPRGGRQGG